MRIAGIWVIGFKDFLVEKDMKFLYFMRVQERSGALCL